MKQQICDRYKLKHTIPGGGMSLTGLYYDSNLNRTVFIKTMNNSTGLEKDSLEREAIVQANLKHENIASIYDLVQDNGVYYIIMEYIKGYNLLKLSDDKIISYLKEKNLNYSTRDIDLFKYKIILDLLKALNYAHEKSIIHRDIKPENIMICEKNLVPKFIDFGLSKQTKEIREEQTVMFYGTPPYMPLEIFELSMDENNDNPKREEYNWINRDIYSMGLTIYKFLTGKLPYEIEGKSHMTIYSKLKEIQNDPILSIRDIKEDIFINEALNNYFMDMIIIDNNKRINNLNPIIKELENFISLGGMREEPIKLPKVNYDIQIRDSILGYINLSEDELKLINNEYFQRLRYIKQLGTTYYIYPSANHTRFEHSLGTMEISTRIFDNIINKQNYLLNWNEDEIRKQRSMLRISSLLHDIGHGPFSHVSDSLFSSKINNHEEMGAKIIEETSLGDLVNNIGSKNGNYNKYEIAGLIRGKNIARYSFIRQIFSGEILDSDKMDYLLRDSYNLGVEYGRYDFENLLSSIQIIKTFNGELTLAINYKGIHSLEEFILSKYWISNQVYFHKTRRIYDVLLSNSIKSMLEYKTGEGFLPQDPREFINYTDYSILEYIKLNHKKKGSYFNRFFDRNHPKMIYEEIYNKYQEDVILKLNQLEVNIKSNDMLNSNLIIDKISQMPPKYLDEEGKPYLSIINKEGKQIHLTSISNILKSYKDPINIFRIYSLDDSLNNIKDIL